MKDKLRRFVFTLSAEGASFFEWSILSSILTLLIGFPPAVKILESFSKGLIAVIFTGIVLFSISFLIVFISEAILRLWPFEISEDEQEFENNYIPRIPYDE